MTTSGIISLVSGVTIPTPAAGQTTLGSPQSGSLATCDASGNINPVVLSSTYMANFVLVPLATNKLRVAYDAHIPAELMIAGGYCKATSPIDLAVAPSGGAATWYIFANGSGSTFTITASASSTESGNRRVAEIYWSGTALVYESLLVYSPGRPSVYMAHVGRVAAQVVANGAWATVSNDTVYANNDGMYSAGAPTLITIVHPGWYIVTNSLGFSASTAGMRAVDIVINATVYPVQSGGAPGFGYDMYFANTFTRFFNAGDYLDIEVYQTSGINRNIWSDLMVSSISA